MTLSISPNLSIRSVVVQSKHCVKSVQIRSFAGPYFSVFSSNTGKYGPEKTPYLDTFHEVKTYSISWRGNYRA